MPVSELPWSGEERRKSPTENERLLGMVISAVHENTKALATIQAQLGAMLIENVNHKAETQVIKDDVEQIKRGFPKSGDGTRDFDGHHDFHQDYIETAKSWKEIWLDVRKKVITGTVWLTLCFLAYSALEAAKQQLKK